MKINLKKKLAPYTIKMLEAEGKQQIEAALKKIDMAIEDLTSDIPNKCEGCRYGYEESGNSFCELDDKVVNAYGCDKELLGNNAEPIRNYPDDNYFEHYDDLDSKDQFLNEFQRGEH